MLLSENLITNICHKHEGIGFFNSRWFESTMCVYWVCVAKFGGRGCQEWLLWETPRSFQGSNSSHVWDNRAKKGNNCATTCNCREGRENVRNSCADTRSVTKEEEVLQSRFPCSLIISHHPTLIWLVVKLSQFPKRVLPETVTDEWSLPVLTLTHEPSTIFSPLSSWGMVT